MKILGLNLLLLDKKFIMGRIFYIYILPIVLFCSCSNPKTNIVALCEQDDKGDYILKWELYPEWDNATLDIFASDNDSIFPESPTVTTISNKYIEVLPSSDELRHRYFKIRVKGSTSGVISNRFYKLDSIQNFRDMGGYRTATGRQIRWGKVFRSGHFARATKRDLEKLSELGIKTIVDLRPSDVANRRPDKLTAENSISIPITLTSYDRLTERAIKGQLYRGDAIIYTQDLYRDIVDNYAEHYAKLFDILLEKENYPVAVHCTFGKDQTGLAVFFLLRALGVTNDVAEEDYTISNIGIVKSRIFQRADTLSENRQEALTMLTHADPAYLRYAVSCIRTKFGSVDEYMKKELRLDEAKCAKLREILLY